MRSFKVKQDIISRRVGKEILLINLTTNQIYELNFTGARFWELLSEGLTDEEIVKTIVEEFQVSEAQLAIESEELLGKLEQGDFITIYDEA